MPLEVKLDSELVDVAAGSLEEVSVRVESAEEEESGREDADEAEAESVEDDSAPDELCVGGGPSTAYDPIANTSDSQ